jgi:hypothetical protein
MTRHVPSCSTVVCFAMLAAAMLLSSCQNPGTPAMSTSMHDTMIKENPNPKQAYRIEMRIENAPGPFGLVEGSAHYDVQNHDECGKINNIAGTIPRIMASPEITWVHKGEGVYETVVHADRLLDEDYYGRGVCHWAMTGAGAILKATGAEGETRFLPNISAADVVSGKAVTLHFVADRYPTVEAYKDFADFGETDLTSFKPEFQDKVFTVTLTPKGD